MKNVEEISNRTERQARELGNLESKKTHEETILKHALHEAYSNKQYKKQCEILVRLAQYYLGERQYSAAAKLLNAALAICESESDKITNADEFKKNLIAELKKIEVMYIKKEVVVPYCPSSPEANGINLQHKKRLEELCVKVKKELACLEGASPIHDEKAALAVQKLNRKITLEVKQILQNMIADCIHLMRALPPCGYAFVATGSLAREEMTPYSDLEYFVLIDSSDPQHKVYFKRLTQLLELKIINLGATDLNKGSTLLPLGMLSPINKGFCLDVHKNPVDTAHDLIGTPQELARYQLTENYVEESDNHLSWGLLQNIYITGNKEELLVQYRKEVHVVYGAANSHANNSLRLKRSLAALEKDVEHFAPKLELENDGCLFSVKDDFYRLPQTIIDALALCYWFRKKQHLG